MENEHDAIGWCEVEDEDLFNRAKELFSVWASDVLLREYVLVDVDCHACQHPQTALNHLEAFLYDKPFYTVRSIRSRAKVGAETTMALWEESNIEGFRYVTFYTKHKKPVIRFILLVE